MPKVPPNIRRCEICNYETKHKHNFEAHVKTKKHLERVEHAGKDENKYHECSLCNRRYNSYTGLWKHKKICKPPTPEPTSTLANIDNPAIVASLQELHQKMDTIQSTGLTTGAPVINQFNQINNNVTNQIINNILHHDVTVKYLNANYKNAMTLDEFIQRIKFKKKDYEIFEKNESGIKSTKELLARQIGEIPVHKRPLHCARPVTDEPTTFFVKTKDEWIQECQCRIEYDLHTKPFARGQSKYGVSNLVDNYANILYDTCDKYSKTDSRFGKYKNKIDTIYQSYDEVQMTRYLGEQERLISPDPANRMIENGEQEGSDSISESSSESDSDTESETKSDNDERKTSSQSTKKPPSKTAVVPKPTPKPKFDLSNKLVNRLEIDPALTTPTPTPNPVEISI